MTRPHPAIIPDGRADAKAETPVEVDPRNSQDSLPMSNRLVAAVQGLDLTRPDLINRHSAHGRGQCTPDAITSLI